MKNNIIILFLLSLLPSLYSQSPRFRPVLNPSVSCSYEKNPVIKRYFNPDNPKKYSEELDLNLEIYYIVEKMPAPRMDLAELELVLAQEVRLNSEEKKSNGKMYFQSIVNCKGKAGDFQIVKCPENLTNVCCQVFNVIQENLTEWQEGKQRDQNVDVFIMIMVEIYKGKFIVTAPAEWRK